jgi:hypothetical protein
MKLHHAALCTLAMAAFAAHAERAPSAGQWRASEATLFDLIQNGYSIVSVTTAPVRSGPLEDTYFLQKTNSVFRCTDTRREASARASDASFTCVELVKPDAS